ncbi:hypothetical protein PHB09_097 [Pseudomonas phage PHB09]|uniref:Uncharacterized protein n=1 Tax=Pseudomonas phage PHB09 TaxID=2867265 RepID=A0AAE9BNC3_9CAUD|nr:hypothetical protein QGX10_gp097 [Pseudomonas phage PHB09]UAV84593.1 hypothetical protein PHB09_097 [Pseudomonas phage PHB09]
MTLVEENLYIDCLNALAEAQGYINEMDGPEEEFSVKVWWGIKDIADEIAAKLEESN